MGGIFVASSKAMAGISTGQLQIVGSVVRHARGPLKGKIHSYLQETGLAGELIESFGGAGQTLVKSTLSTGNPAFGTAMAATNLASSITGNVQNEFIRQGVNRVEGKVDELAKGMQTLESLGVANLALSATGIGVSLVGFGLMNARLTQVESALTALTQSTDRILAAIEKVRHEQLIGEFTGLRSQVKLFEEAWLMSDQNRAAQLWLEVAQSTRSHQDRFEARARELLFAMPPEFELADPMVDAVSLAGGLRVACFMACNESTAAQSAANENARQIEGLTGGFGTLDLAMARLPSGIDIGSDKWGAALADASEAASSIAQRWRQRELVAATRAAPLNQLKEYGISPHDWLSTARKEAEDPVLLLAASDDAQ